MMALTLVTLPAEILSNILQWVNPADLGKIPQTCRTLHVFVRDNRILFKAVYCQSLDVPNAEVDYIKDLKDLVHFQTILASRQSVQEKARQVQFISNVAIRALRLAAPRDSKTIELLSDHLSDNRIHKSNTEALLCQSTTYARANDSAHLTRYLETQPSFDDRQASAKLHVHYGLSHSNPKRTRGQGPYGYAASMVYDLRNYKAANFWGPYQDTGDAKVDWEKMEAVMILLGFNLQMFRRHAHKCFTKHLGIKPFEGATPNSYVDMGLSPYRKRPVLAVPTLDHEIPRSPVASTMNDPYNVSGTWFRIVCFLDFHDLFAYNFTNGAPPAEHPRPAINTTEAIRLINMELKATKIEAPGEEDGKDLPVVYFEGTSRSMHSSWDPNANSNIRGSVRLTKEGEVRWQTVSVYAGEERWKSEGIQVGGPCSARGVIGHWFDKDYDHHGPAGPTMFFKASDSIRESYSSDVDDFDESEDEEDEESMAANGYAIPHDDDEDEATILNDLNGHLLGHIEILEEFEEVEEDAEGGEEVKEEEEEEEEEAGASGCLSQHGTAGGDDGEKDADAE